MANLNRRINAVIVTKTNWIIKKERHSFNATGMREKKKRKLSNTTSKLLGRPMCVNSHPVDICQLPSHIGTLKKSFTPLCVITFPSWNHKRSRNIFLICLKNAAAETNIRQTLMRHIVNEFSPTIEALFAHPAWF